MDSAPRRILYLETNEDGTVGGSHQALYDLVRHLDRQRYEPVLLFYQRNSFESLLRQEGFEVHLFERERAREIDIRRNRGRLCGWADLFGAVVRRYRFLRRHRIDAVHNNNSPRVANDDWLPAARLRRIPIFAYAMGDARGASGFIHRWLFRQFDLIMPISEYMWQSLLANRVPRDRITLVPLGVDIERIRSHVGRSTAEVRKEFEVREDQVLVAMVGNIRRWKGQHVVLEALHLLSKEDRRRIHVVFAGAVREADLEYHDALRVTTAAHGLEPHVSWLGARSDVPDIFSAADLALHCSVGPEPFGLVLVEAMALGTPVAAASSGGPAEIVKPESGWLHDPARPSELAEILRVAVAEPSILRKFSAGARSRALDYSIEKMVDETSKAYQLVLGD